MSVVLILLVSLFCLSTVAFASTSEQDGLKVELTTDKENYSLNEDIKINVTVTNTNDVTVENVKIDTLLPEEFTLKDKNKSTSSEAVDIPAGKKIEFSVVAVVKDGKSDKTSSDTDSKLTGTSTNNKDNINKQNDKSPYTGKDYAVMTGFSALFIIGIVLLILCLKRNRKKTSKAVSSALCLVLAVTSIIGLADFKAKAENKQSTTDSLVAESNTDTSSVISISDNISVNGKDYTVEANVNYMAKEELTNYNLTEWVKSEETISNTVENLRKTEEYKSANYNEKVQLMEQCLKQLQEKGLIKNLHYNDYIFHFDYSISGSGGIVVKDTHNDNCWGSSPNARTKPIEFNQSIFNETLLNYANSTSTANSKNQNWAFIFGTSTTEDNMSYNQFNWLASECKDLDINVSVQENSTVSMYRNLSNKDLIYITGHAFFDEQKSIPVIWTSEQLTKEKLTNINYLFGIIPDINNNSIGIYENESGQKFFVILPAFFENNYSNNELAGSIVLFGHCQIFGKNNQECLALYNSLKKSGASTVIGFCNSVNQTYSLFFHEKIINCLLRGKTIGDAFNEAKDSIGKNENECFKEHHSNLSLKEKPAFPILKGLTNKKLIYSDLEKLGEYGFTIKDIDSQKPIENVRVLIYNSENGRECVHSYKSNEKGDVSVELPDGKYTCELVHSLYETMTQNITIESGVTTIVKNTPIYMKRKISTGSITGIVKDSTTNNPIKDVEIEVIDNSSDSFDPITTTKTNENGNFSLNLPYGSYSISFNHSDYNYYGTTVDVDCETVVLTEPILLKKDNKKLSKEEIIKKLELHYNRLPNVKGTYSITDVEDTDTELKACLRYSMSNEEAEEIIANGGFPTPNKLVTGLTVDKATGLVTEDVGDGYWYLWFNQTELINAYSDKLNEKWNEIKKENPNEEIVINYSPQYMLYDIDNNGIMELIIDMGTSESNRTFEFYTYKNGLINLGTVSGGHSVITVPSDKNGLYLNYSHMDTAHLYRLTLDGGKIKKSTIFENKDYEYADKYKSTLLKEYHASDLSELNKKLAN